MSYSQKNWIQLLLMTQVTYNNKKIITTRQILFYGNYEYYPTLFIISKISLQVINIL